MANTATQSSEASASTARNGSRLGPIVSLVRVDIYRGLRWVRAQDFWMLYSLFSAIGLLLGTFFAFQLGSSLGAALAATDPLPFSMPTLRTLFSTVWILLVGVLIVDAIGSNGDVVHDGHYLTILPANTLVRGKLLSAALKFSLFLFMPLAGAFLGLALVTGNPAVFIGGLLVGLVLVTSATPIGYAIGLTLKGVTYRSTLLTWLKPLLIVVAIVGYIVVMVSGEFVTLIQQLAPVLRTPPLGWFADLAFVTTSGFETSLAGACGAIGVGVGVTCLGYVATVPAARFAWGAERMETGDRSTAETVDAPTQPLDSLLGMVIPSQATRTVASTTLQRVYRSPLQLIFVAIPLVAVIPIVERLLATGTMPWYAPWFVVWYGSWVAGAAIPLNPLGNQGATLPTVLTAPAHGRQVTNGHVLAAALPIAPLTAGIAVVLGILSDQPVTDLVVIAVTAIAAVFAATVLAAGIGSVFPRFEAIDFGSARKAVPPSKVAYSVFSTVLSLTVCAVAVISTDFLSTAVAQLISAWLPFGLDIVASTVTTGSWIFVCLVVVAIAGAYVVAVRRIDRYRL